MYQIPTWKSINFWKSCQKCLQMLCHLIQFAIHLDLSGDILVQRNYYIIVILSKLQKKNDFVDYCCCKNIVSSCFLYYFFELLMKDYGFSIFNTEMKYHQLKIQSDSTVSLLPKTTLGPLRYLLLERSSILKCKK